MDIRTLETVSYETLHRAFLAAFADYAIRFELTLEQLTEMHRRRGVRLDLSVGAFEDGRIVGFTFNGFGPWEGEPAGYDAGTGVLPSARGRGLASIMMERSLELLRPEGAKRYVLEVLQSNTAAFRIYEGVGFQVTREFLAWNLDRVLLSPRTDVDVATKDSIDRIPAADMWDWSPSWQHSLDSIRRADEPKTILVATKGDEVLGYAVVFASGDLAQLAVARTERRRGVGATLLHAARSVTGHPLRIVNTDARDTGTTSFLKAAGAQENVRQYEMVLHL